MRALLCGLALALVAGACAAQDAGYEDVTGTMVAALNSARMTRDNLLEAAQVRFAAQGNRCYGTASADERQACFDEAVWQYETDKAAALELHRTSVIAAQARRYGVPATLADVSAAHVEWQRSLFVWPAVLPTVDWTCAPTVC